MNSQYVQEAHYGDDCEINQTWIKKYPEYITNCFQNLGFAQ